MASTIGEALAEIQGPEFDLAVGYAKAQPRHQPVDTEVSIAFAGFSGKELVRLAVQLAAAHRTELQDAEDAVQDALLKLMESRPELFTQEPMGWMALLHEVAKFRLLNIKSSRRSIASIEQLQEAAGDAPLNDARPCVAETLQEDPKARLLMRKAPQGKWSQAEIVGAIIRFRDYYGRPPRSKDFRSINGLPGLKALSRHYQSVSEAILAAGMTPASSIPRRKPYSALAAARQCESFRMKEGRWPDWADVKRDPRRVPPTSAMIRFFGGTRACDVQSGSERILGVRAKGAFTEGH